MVDTIVLGLDGLDSGLVTKELTTGKMSTCLELLQEGTMDIQSIDSYKMDKWEFPWTGHAWSCIYSGATEDYHDVNVPGWQSGTVNFTKDLKDTVYDDISHSGLTVGVFRMAITFPARPVNGWMLSGFPGGGKDEIVDNEIRGISRDVMPGNYLGVKDKRISGETSNELGIIRAEDEKLDVFDEIVANSGYNEDVLFYGTQVTDKAAHRFHLMNTDVDDFWKSRIGTMTAMKADEIIEHMIDTYDPDTLLAISDHGMKRFEDNHSMRATMMEYRKDGTPDLSAAESILDFRDVICDRLGIERKREVFSEANAAMTDAEEEIIEERLEDMGYI